MNFFLIRFYKFQNIKGKTLNSILKIKKDE